MPTVRKRRRLGLALRRCPSTLRLRYNQRTTSRILSFGPKMLPDAYEGLLGRSGT